MVLTDHPWPDLDIERDTLGRAGLELVSGPRVAGTASAIEQLVGQVDPICIMTCWAPVSRVAVRMPSHLAIIARMGVGIDNIAVEEATLRGAYVTNVPDYCAAEVSDHAIALMLAHVRGIPRFDRRAKLGVWQTETDGLERISDLTVAVIGLGRIGRQTARKLAVFGCRVIALTGYATDVPEVRYVGLEEIQAQADVLILHVPLTDRTSKFIDRTFLRGCRKGPLLINVSRGGLVDNDALLWALKEGYLRGAALDVIDGEPAPPDEVIRHPLVIATPHVAFASRGAINELRRRACEEVVRVLSGQAPEHPCNEPLVGTPLPGGVASDIRVVQGVEGPEVVKRSLAKLKVAADWFSDPARSSTEVAAIAAVAQLLGQLHVPRVLWNQPEQNRFAMALVAPRFKNWKAELMAGRADVRTAFSAGDLLGRLHTRAAGDDALKTRFESTKYFQELRIEPFFLRVAIAEPAFGMQIERIAREMLQRRTTLVHGDFSPKNILADGPEIVILDYEVTHWGDPRFDVAFCATHLILKCQRRDCARPLLMESLRTFLNAYESSGPPILDRHVVAITGCLLMARLSGASPVEYLTDIDIPCVREIALEMIDRPDCRLEHYLPRMARPQ